LAQIVFSTTVEAFAQSKLGPFWAQSRAELKPARTVISTHPNNKLLLMGGF